MAMWPALGNPQTRAPTRRRHPPLPSPPLPREKREENPNKPLSLSYLSQGARGSSPIFSPSLSKYSAGLARPSPPNPPPPRALFPAPHYSRDSPAPPPVAQLASCPPCRRRRPPEAEEAGRHGQVHAQEQGLGGGGRHGGRRRAARRPHPLPHPRRAAAARALPLAAAQGPGGRPGGPRRCRLPRAQEQEAREAAAAGAQGEGGRAADAGRRREGDGAGAVVRGRGVRGRPRGLLRRQRAGLGRRRQGHQGDDAVQPDLQLGDDEHPRVGDRSPQPFPLQGADAGLPLRPELARDGRVLRRSRAAATPDLQGQVQLLPRKRAPAPRTIRVDGARLLGLFPHTTTTRSSSIDLSSTKMTTTRSSSSSSMSYAVGAMQMQ